MVSLAFWWRHCLKCSPSDDDGFVIQERDVRILAR